MRIEEELKLDFQDVLIRPRRSTLTSRSDVDISREFVFRHSGRDYRGVPIIAANMDTVGTFEMAQRGVIFQDPDGDAAAPEGPALASLFRIGIIPFISPACLLYTSPSPRD